MLNQLVLVGILVGVSEEKESSCGYKYNTILLDVRRPFKNSEGKYDVDTFKISFWSSDTRKRIEHVGLNSVIAVKGRIQSNKYEKNNNIFNNYEIFAEKISVVSNDYREERE